MQTIKLGEIAKIDISNVDKKAKENETPVILCNFVDVYYNWAITSSMIPDLMTATANANQIERFSIHKGQVAITKDSETRDDIGVATYIADEIPNGVLGYHCALITPDETILNGKYLNVLLHSSYAQKYFEANASGSGQRYTLTAEIIAGLPVPLPNIETQQKIGKIFSDIDRKIENNNAMNIKLESMAKTIYDYWFLQFEFPDENGKPYKSSGGKMVWSDELKRNIPKKFKVADILSVCQVIDCLHSKKPTYAFENEKYYLLTLENLAKDGTIDLSEKFYISKKDYEEWISRIEVKENDFVVTNAGRAGDVCKIPKNVKCAIGRNITAIRPTDIDPYYLRCFFKSNYLREQILGNLDCGAFFMSFNVKSIKKLKILIPSQTVFDDFIEKVKPIILQIEENIIQNQELASLRDFLLPLLMNGQVTFK